MEQQGGSSGSLDDREAAGQQGGGSLDDRELFGMAPENYQATQLNEGEEFNPVSQMWGGDDSQLSSQQESQMDNSSLLQSQVSQSQASQMGMGHALPPHLPHPRSPRGGSSPRGAPAPAGDHDQPGGHSPRANAGAASDRSPRGRTSVADLRQFWEHKNKSVDQAARASPRSGGSPRSRSPVDGLARSGPPSVGGDARSSSLIIDPDADLFGGDAPGGVSENIDPDADLFGERAEDNREFGSAMEIPESQMEALQQGDTLENLFGEEEEWNDDLCDSMLDAVTQIQEQKQNQEVAIPDEEELFGHMSEGEDDADAEKVDLRNVDIITNNITMFKIPPTVNFEQERFVEKKVAEELRHTFDVQEGSLSSTILLKNPENSLRWRIKVDKDGEMVKDAAELPVFESNARMCEFETGKNPDGTPKIQRYLFIGEQPFEILERITPLEKTRDHLFSATDNDVLVHHQPITKTITAVPLGLATITHNTLKNAQIKKVAPERRLMYVTDGQIKERKERYLLDKEQEKKEQKIKDREERRDKKKQKVFDRDFLEGGAPGGADESLPGVSLKNLKRGRGGDDEFHERVAKRMQEGGQ